MELDSDPRVIFVKGFFQESHRLFLRKFDMHGHLVVHNDSDCIAIELA